MYESVVGPNAVLDVTSLLGNPPRWLHSKVRVILEGDTARYLEVPVEIMDPVFLHHLRAVRTPVLIGSGLEQRHTLLRNK
jgi:hypothetical protein